jgi:probable phosphoglycerate mutase
VILLVGFHPVEVPPLADLVGALAQEMDAGELAVARVAGDALGVSAEFLLDGADVAEDETTPFALPPAARCVLLRGDPAMALMPDLKLEMVESGFEPAVFGVFVPAHAGKPLGAVAAAVVAAHERYWDLGAEAKDDSFRVSATSWPGEEAWSPVSPDITCAMSAVIDAAQVPDPPAFPHAAKDDARGTGTAGDERVDRNPATGTRRDASAVLVLDGVVGESLRSALLEAITEKDWPHASASGPPPGKWTRDTADGVNDEDPNAIPKKSWGLSSDALERVQKSAPVLCAVARIGALYPEYAVRFMPADSLEPEGIPGGMSSLFGNGNDDDGGGGGAHTRIATVVGNAAVREDQFEWHLDMDPDALSPSSPFAERFGRYVNRSHARPLFVSALVYLNGPPETAWTPDKDAETLVLDPGTGTGIFIRPAPGRVLLMDQDALHRVSPPSKTTEVPRYSLVFKLCFYPKDPATRPSLLREEWGKPIEFGTAGGRRAGRGIVGGCEESEEYRRAGV